MPQTVRQMMIDCLREGPSSAKDLSAWLGIPEREVLPHLEHVRKSLQHGGGGYEAGVDDSGGVFV